MRSIDSTPGVLSRFITYLTYEPNLERKIRTGSPIGPGSPLAPFSPCNVKKERPGENRPVVRLVPFVFLPSLILHVKYVYISIILQKKRTRRKLNNAVFFSFREHNRM